MERDTEVAFDALKTRFGPVYVAVSSHGLVSIGLGGSLPSFRDRVWNLRHAAPRKDPRTVQPYARQIREYLSGRRQKFALRIDWWEVPSFQRRVLTATSRIPYGKTATYGEIAQQVGRRGAARAVGQALGSNPLPLVIPCHRVLGAGGKLVGFSAPGGVGLKRRLLDLEGAVLPRAEKSSLTALTRRRSSGVRGT